MFFPVGKVSHAVACTAVSRFLIIEGVRTEKGFERKIVLLGHSLWKLELNPAFLISKTAENPSRGVNGLLWKTYLRTIWYPIDVGKGIVDCKTFFVKVMDSYGLLELLVSFLCLGRKESGRQHHQRATCEISPATNASQATHD